MDTKNKKITPLGRIRDILDRHEYLIRYEPTYKGREFEQLFVGLFQNDYLYTYVMELFFINDFSNVLKLKDSRVDEECLALLQFHSEFPFDFSDAAYRYNLSDLLESINFALPYGHFGILERSFKKHIFFRYVYPSEDPMKISQQVVTETIKIAENAMSRLDPLFRKLAHNQISATELFQLIKSDGLFA